MRTTSFLTSSFSLVLAVFVAQACDDNTGTTSADVGPLLRTLTENVAIPAHTAFATKADALANATATLDAASLPAAQAAWRDARRGWRALDAVHFGPVADLGITERINLAPATGTAIRAMISGTAALDVAAVGAVGGAPKGFLGLEYILFAPDAGAKLGSDERRRTLAHSMATEIATSAHQLADAWTTGGYANEIEKAGAGSTRYGSQRAAVDDFVGGIGFALELVVGVRLAAPLGRKTGGAPDPTQDPTRSSDSAVADMNATLAGVQALYRGDGFSAAVRAKNVQLDTNAVSELADCSAKVAQIPAPFATTVTANTPSVDAAYQSCKTLKATWNADITSALGATLKPGDNDGD